jgi:cell division protein ZapA
MAGGVSIKVNIADKEYPLKVNNTEVEAVRQAEQEIQQKISELKANYQVRDNQTLLAMCALQLIVEKNQNGIHKSVMDSGIFEKLAELESFVSDYVKRK